MVLAGWVKRASLPCVAAVGQGLFFRLLCCYDDVSAEVVPGSKASLSGRFWAAIPAIFYMRWRRRRYRLVWRAVEPPGCIGLGLDSAVLIPVVRVSVAGL